MPQTRRHDLVSRVVDGEVLILDRAAGRVHRLNHAASYIWDACDGRSASEIATEMAAHFGAIPDAVINDVQATLSDFRRLGLVLDALGEVTEGAREVNNE